MILNDNNNVYIREFFHVSKVPQLKHKTLLLQLDTRQTKYRVTQPLPHTGSLFSYSLHNIL